MPNIPRLGARSVPAPETGALTAAGLFLDAYRTSAGVMRDIEQSRRADQQLELQKQAQAQGMIWKAEDRAYEQSQRPMQEEMNRLRLANERLSQSRETFALEEARRRAEAGIAEIEAQRANDGLGEQYLARLDKLRNAPADDSAADEEIVSIVKAIRDMTEGGVFSKDMTRRATAGYVTATTHPRYKAAEKNSFVRNSLKLMAQEINSLPADWQDGAIRSTGIRFKSLWQDGTAQTEDDIGPDQISRAIDNLTSFKKRMEEHERWNATRTAPKPQPQPSMTELRGIIESKDSSAAAKAAAQTMLNRQLGVPTATGTSAGAELLLPPASNATKEDLKALLK